MLKDDFGVAGLLPAPPTAQMEGQRPELIPYFHSSQGPAEAAEPMKAAFRARTPMRG